jgi:Ribonuclease G/E
MNHSNATSTSNSHVCGRCNGTGHDRGGRPEIHFEERIIKGKKRKLHVTDKQGSGCMKCLGVGHV